MARKLVYSVEFEQAKALAQAKQMAGTFKRELQDVAIKIDTKAATAAAKQAAAGIQQAEKQITQMTVAEAHKRLGITQQEEQARQQAIRETVARSVAAEEAITADYAAEARKRAQLAQQQAKPANPTTSPKPAGGFGVTGALIKGGAALLTVQAARQAAQYALAISDARAANLRAASSFEILAGSAKEADSQLRAIRSASGTIDKLTAQQIAVQANALKLADTAKEMAAVTRAAREVTLVSATIGDVQSALTELSIFAANPKNFARADQLGLDQGSIKDRMKELMDANAGMDESTAKLQATIQLLDERYGKLLDSQAAAASGAENLRRAWADLKGELAQSDIAGSIDEGLNQIAGTLDRARVMFGSEDATAQQSAIDQMVKNAQAMNAGLAAVPGLGSLDLAGQKAWEQFSDNFKTLFDSANDGVIGIENYREAATQTLADVTRQFGIITEAQQASMQTMASATANASEGNMRIAATAQTAAEAAAYQREQVEGLAEQYIEMGGEIAAFAQGLVLSGANVQDFNERIAGMAEFFDKKAGVKEGALSGASALVEQFGVEEANRILEQQIQQIELTFQKFQRMGIRGGPLLDLGIADLENQLAAQVDGILAEADRLQELANLDGITSQLSQSLSNLNSGAFDGVEGISAIRNELLGMASDVMFAAGATDEQAARFAYLSAVAYAASDSASAYGQTQAALGVEFLNTNDYAGALASEMANLDGALATGAISADYHRAALLTLVNAIYAAAVAAGAAAPALANLLSLKNALNAAGPVNTPEGQRGAAAADAIQRREALRASVARREQLRDRQEQAAKDAAKAQEKAAKETAKGFKDAAKSAAKDFNSAAKSARSAFENVAKSLESALRNVEGLFGTSKVTQEDLDLAEAGGAVNKADDWLRRLRDEVENGKDWAGVSIEQAKEALSRIGVETGDSAKEILARFEQAWSDSSLFASKENLAFINQDAVRQQLEIQDKIKEGQKNILELFGATVDGVMAGVKAGDPMLTGLVASELEGSDDKQAQEWAKGLREGKQSVIDKVLEMAQAELQELTGGGGGASAGGGADSPLGIDYSIPERDIFDPLEMGAQQAGDSLGLFGTEVEGWLDAAWASRVPGAPKPDAFGPMPNPTGDIYGALGPLLGALKPGTAGAMAGPGLDFDPATATDYANDLIAALQSPANVALLEAAGAPMGTSVAQGLQNATFTEHTAAYFAKLSEAFNTPEGAGHAQRVGKDVGAVIAFGMKDAAFASQVASYLGKLKTAFSMNDVLEPQKAIGKDIGGRIALAMGDAAMTTQAIAYLEKVSSALSAQPTTSLGKTLGGQIASGLDDGDYTTQAKAYITALDTTFDVVDKAYIGKTIGIQIAGGLNDADYTEQAKAYITALDTTFDVVDKAYVGKTIGGQIAAGLDDADLTENVASYITALAGQFETADISPISSVLSGRLTASMQAGPTEVEGDDGKVRRIIDPASGAGAAKAIDDAFLAYQHADLAGDFRTDLSAQFTVITPNLEALGYNAATFIDFGFQDYDFGPSVDGMIGNLSAAFKKDDSIAQLKGLGSFVGEAIFSGFRDSLSGQRWLDALRDELVSAASTQIATGLADQMNATVTTGTGGGRP